LDIYAAADAFYINQNRRLVRDDVRVMILHEVLQVTRNLPHHPLQANPAATEANYDNYMNGANADHRGPIVYDASAVDQGDVQAQLGITHRQVSYLASILQVDPRCSLLAAIAAMLGTDTFSQGNEIDIARFGDILATNQNNIIRSPIRYGMASRQEPGGANAPPGPAPIFADTPPCMRI
jgi:hypothetical protein